jgi:hypothetical protein
MDKENELENGIVENIDIVENQPENWNTDFL